MSTRGNSDEANTAGFCRSHPMHLHTMRLNPSLCRACPPLTQPLDRAVQLVQRLVVLEVFCLSEQLQHLGSVVLPHTRMG